MINLITVRIYFEYGQKLTATTFWKKLNASSLTNELIKQAKSSNIAQILNFNVTKGYFDKGKIHWGVGESKSFRHPQVIEIIDSEEKITHFLEEQKALFANTKIVMVKNEMQIR